ncbi:MAG: CvpA family protein [bacterium]
MTWFDLIVIAIMGLSILLAFIQGIMREMTVLLALALAAVLAWYSHGVFANILGLEKQLSILIVLAALFGCLFVILLVIMNLLLGRAVSIKPGRIDRILGGLFGFIRGYFLIGLAYLALLFLFDADHMPPTIANSLTQGFARSAAGILEDMGLENTGSEVETKPQTKRESA